MRRLCESARIGVSIGFNGENKKVICPNWPSAKLHKEHVDKFINDNLHRCRVEGPMSYIDLPDNFRCSPLGAVVHKRSSKVRIIHDLSWPHEESVNDGIDDQFCSLQYTSIDDAVTLVSQYKDPHCAKTDLSSAYLSVHVRQDERHLLGFSWPGPDGEDQYYTMSVLPFGCKSSCRLFNEFACALEYISIIRGASPTTIHYLDDFLTVSEGEKSTQESLDIIIKTCQEAGFDIQPSKTVKPTKIIEFLGIVIDCVHKQLRISEERLQEVYDELVLWITRKWATKRELLSLIGKLSFCSKVVRDGEKFIRRLIHLSKKPKKMHHKVSITPQARSDISWWLHCMAVHNGVTMFPKELDITTAEIVFSDASDYALGFLCHESWTIVEFTDDYSWIKSQTIAYKELLAVVFCIATFGDRLAQKQVAMNIDNSAVCWCVNTGKSKDVMLMSLIRVLYYYTSIYNIQYHAFHLFTDQNVSADALSRLNMERFWSLNPNADLAMTPPAEIIYDF